MKHVFAITRKPAKAQDVTFGQILTVISQILTVVATFIVEKEAAQVEDY